MGLLWCYSRPHDQGHWFQKLTRVDFGIFLRSFYIINLFSISFLNIWFFLIGPWAFFFLHSFMWDYLNLIHMIVSLTCQSMLTRFFNSLLNIEFFASLFFCFTSKQSVPTLWSRSRVSVVCTRWLWSFLYFFLN
jgi:hypothetical protein